MYLSFNISFPYKKHTKHIDYVVKTWSISKNKSLELQISKWGNSWTLFGIIISPSWYRSHSGFLFDITLFNYCMIINFYDNRHWNYEEGRWCRDDEYD
jgi:hypothetical protein